MAPLVSKKLKRSKFEGTDVSLRFEIELRMDEAALVFFEDFE